MNECIDCYRPDHAKCPSREGRASGLSTFKEAFHVPNKTFVACGCSDNGLDKVAYTLDDYRF